MVLRTLMLPFDLNGDLDRRYRLSNDSRIGPAVLVNKGPLTLHQRALQIIVRIGRCITQRPVAHFEVEDIRVRFIEQTVRISAPRLEARTHAGRQRCLALIGVKRGMALQDVHELVLMGVRMP